MVASDHAINPTAAARGKTRDAYNSQRVKAAAIAIPVSVSMTRTRKSSTD